MTLCWLNGAFQPTAMARIDPTDRGFTLGDGVFETIAVRNGTAHHLGRHLRRLRDGAAELALECPWPDEACAGAIAHLAQDKAGGPMAARMTLSRGPAGRGLALPNPASSTLLITLAPAPPASAPTEAIICRSTCRNEKSPLSRIKSLNYLDNILARIEAEQAGANEALLLNTAGRVAEATTANLLVLSRGALYTPPTGDGALPGIARDVLMQATGIIERSLTEQDLLAADALILTNSLGLREIARLGDRHYAPAPLILSALEAMLHSGESLAGQGLEP